MAVGNLWAQEALSLHQVPDPGAGERVPLQHVPHKRPQSGDCQVAESHGKTGENLVSEPEDETEEDESIAAAGRAHVVKVVLTLVVGPDDGQDDLKFECILLS